jgi:CheY-like chemotaxis protein
MARLSLRSLFLEQVRGCFGATTASLCASNLLRLNSAQLFSHFDSCSLNREAGLQLSAVRILVVDDFEPFGQFVVELSGKRPELQVVGEASDGLEALRKALRKAVELRPDLILLDVGLPSLNGMEVARQLRSLVPESKIIFLTQESSADVVREALSLGARGYVVKTKARTDVLAAVEAVVSGNRSGRAIRDAAIQRIGGAVMANRPGRGEVLLLALLCLLTAMVIVSLVR